MSDSSANIKFTADTGQAVSALQQVKNYASEFGSTLVSKLNPAVAALKAGTYVAGMLKSAFTDLVKESKKLINESLKFNIPVAELQKMKAVADECGVAAGSIVRAMKGLTKVLISDKTDPKYRILSQMGLSDDDMQKMESNKGLAMEKIKAIYSTLSDVDKEKFGLAIFGGGFNQIKPMLEQTAESAEDASARIYQANDSTILSFKALGNTWDDFKEMAKELVGWLGPWIGVLAELLSIVLSGALWVLKEALSGVTYIFAQFVAGMEFLGGAILKVVSLLLRLASTVGLVKKSVSDAVSNLADKTVDDSIERNKKANESFVNKLNENNDKLKASAIKTGRNLLKDSNAIAEQMDFRTSGQKVKEEEENYKKSTEALENSLREKRQLEEAYKIKQDTHTLTGGDVQEYSRESSRINDEIEKQKKLQEEAKHNIAIYGEKSPENEKSTTKLVDPKKEDKEFKQKLKTMMETADAAESEMKTKEKLLAVEKDIAQLNELKKELSLDENNNSKKLSEVKDEILKKEKELGKLRKKSLEEDEAERLRQAQEKTKLEDMAFKNKEKYQELLEKDKIEKMKKEGYSQQEIDKVIFQQKMEKLIREQEQLEKTQEDAKKEGTAKNIEAVEKQKGALVGAFGEANDAMRSMMYGGGSSTVSSAAKKGMGGGVSSNPVDKLTAVNNKQLEQLVEIRKYLEKQLEAKPFPLAPK